LQREDLTDLELARGYESLIKEYNMTQEQVANTVNKSRSSVANTLRLMKLPQSVKIMLTNTDISSGHARALLSLEDNDLIEQAAQQIVDNNLSVRETEKLVSQMVKSKEEQPTVAVKEKTDRRPQFYREVELSLNESLGRKVTVNRKNKNNGTLVLEFYGEDDLRELLKHFKDEY